MEVSVGEGGLRDLAGACAVAKTLADLAAAIQVAVRVLDGCTAHLYRVSAPGLHVEAVPVAGSADRPGAPQAFVGEHPVIGLLAPGARVARASDGDGADELLHGAIGQTLLAPHGAEDELLLRLGPVGAPTWLGIGLAADEHAGILERAAIARALLADAYDAIRIRQLDRAFAVTAGALLERRGRVVLVADGEGELRGLDGRRPGPAAGTGVPDQLLTALRMVIARDVGRELGGGTATVERETEITMSDARGATVTATVLPASGGSAHRPIVIDLPRQPTSAEDLGRLGLSGRQAEVLALILSGETTSAVGNQLGISSKTAQKHLEQAYRRLGAHGRLEALAHVLEAV